MPKQSAVDRARLLNRVPPGAARIQVKQPDGRLKWKELADIEDLDEVMSDKSGEPVVMQNKPGRKRKTELAPASDDVAEIMEVREDFIETTPLVQAVDANPDSDDVIEQVLKGMAAEAAALEFERKEAERNNRDNNITTNISVRRGRILKAMADIWVKRRSLAQGGLIDLEGEAAKKLIGFVLETVRASMEDVGLRDEAIETVFVKLSKKLDDGWKQEAIVRMKEGGGS